MPKEENLSQPMTQEDGKVILQMLELILQAQENNSKMLSSVLGYK